MPSLFEKIRHGNHLYVFYKGDLIYKQWLNEEGKKTQPSALFNKSAWPTVWIIDEEKSKKSE